MSDQGTTRLLEAYRDEMCAQVMQRGAIELVEETGAEQYQLNFQPKPTHFVTVGTDWAEDGTTGEPRRDIADLAEVLRRDGKAEPNVLIFGTEAFRRFRANADIQSELE